LGLFVFGEGGNKPTFSPIYDKL